MNDFLGVDMFQSLNELVDVVPSLDFVQALASPNKIRQGAVSAYVQHDVDVLLVFKVLFEPHHAFVGQRSVDFNLTGEFLPCFCSCQIRLGNDLKSPRLVGFEGVYGWLDLLDLVALCKAAL